MEHLTVCDRPSVRVSHTNRAALRPWMCLSNRGKNNTGYSLNSIFLFSFGFSNIHGSDSSSDFRVGASGFGHFAQTLNKLYIFLKPNGKTM